MISSKAQPVASPLPALFRNRTFLLILSGNVISQMGDGFHSVALGLWVLQTTGSASAMSAVVIIRMVVGILLGPVGGTLADRTDRWRLMWVLDFVRGAGVFGIALLIARPASPFASILILTGLVSLFSQLRSPAFAASFIHMVDKEDLQQARSLMQISGTAAQVVGPLLGGAVVAVAGGWAAMTGDAASFVISGLFVLLGGTFPSPRHGSGPRRSFWTDMAEGWSYIRRNPFAMTFTVMGPAINFFTNAGSVLIPVLAVKVWLASPIEFGAIESGLPLGLAIGGAAVMALGKRLTHRRGRLISLGLLTLGPIYILFAAVGRALPAVVLLVVLGMVLAFMNILLVTALQTQTDPAMQGRVFGTLGSLANVATPLSVALAGPLADHLGSRTVMGATGILLVLVVPVALAGMRALRTWD